MYLRGLILAIAAAGLAASAAAQVSISRGAQLSVDASNDGRLAIDLRGDLWVVPGGGGEAKQLTENLKSAQRPRWSPDGKRLVYQASANGQQGIWVHELATNVSRNVSAEANLDLHPSWHPDGERVLYSSDTDGSGIDLWEVDIPTGVRWRISNRPGDETDGAWSADGRDLVYVHHNAGRWSLILRRHGRAEEVLVTSSAKLAAPSWRPDGSLILFFRTTDSGPSLDMVILSSPRLVRTYSDQEQFVVTPVAWLDRHRMYYSANGQIRQRLFNAWKSAPVTFKATIQPRVVPSVKRKRQPLPWHDEPNGRFIVHAARLYDGLGETYRSNLDIAIEGGRIVSLAKHSDHSGAIVIDMGDLTVMPGFIDADARLPATITASYGPDLLTMGITTIVAPSPEAKRLNKLWSGKEIPGPRFLDAEQWSIGPTSRPELDVTAAVVTSRSTGRTSGSALATQLRAMDIAGLTPAQTLRGMGVNAAAAMLADPYLGRIAVGSAADLIFVDGDPLADINDALNMVAVVRNGRFYSVSGLFDRAKRAESVE